MPVDFLNDDQAAAYGGYVGEVEEAELQRYFFLDDEDVARLSPFVQAHVNTQGRYSFARPELGGELRTLSDPDEDGLGGGSKGSAG